MRPTRRRNVVQARSFADLLEQSLRRYQNRAIETAQVIEELIALAEDMRAANARGASARQPLAFYRAVLRRTMSAAPNGGFLSHEVEAFAWQSSPRSRSASRSALMTCSGSPRRAAIGCILTMRTLHASSTKRAVAQIHRSS